MKTEAKRILPVLAALLAVVAWVVPGAALAGEKIAKVPVEVFTLDNGMKFLLVQKPDVTTVSAGWVAHVGSSNEREGITGLTHLLEHMMFKGTKRIGTKDIEKDLRIIDEQEKIQEKIRKIYRELRAKYRRGEIDDPYDPKNFPPELVELKKKFQQLVNEQRANMVKDEFDQVYTKAGGSGMNAFTNQDMTVYFITLPANKLELWFWMESDRLYEPVFREFYSERDVVHEERRLRTESTPTGKFDELFEAMFWQSHPYHWPVIGWPSDLVVISKKDADDYFETFYRPNNLTAAIVGNFDPAEVKRLAKKYFGRIPRSTKETPDVVTLEMPQLAEKRMVAECDCQPQVEVRYHTVPFRHKDSYALEVLANLLNGRSGRLHRSLVLEQGIATSAYAMQNSQKWAGYFSFGAEAKGDATPEQLEQAWYEELRKIIEEPIPDEELQKVKNQITAGAYRRLQNPFFLMLQLLYYDGLGDWTYINDWAEKTLAVTADDVKRVAKKYLTKENRTVGLYYRKAGTKAEEIPPELADLPPQARQALWNQVKEIRKSTDRERLQQALERMGQQKAQVPPQFRKAFDLMEREIRARLDALSKEGAAESGKAATPAKGGE